MLEFAYPWAFALALAPLLVRWLLPPIKTPVGAVRVPFFGDLVGASRLRPGPGSVSSARRGWQWAVLIAAYALLLCALAKPQWVGDPIERVEAARDLMLAVDISGSMDERDLKSADGEPLQRLDAVKRVVGEFIARRDGDRVGLIVFGSRAYLQAPFTTDLAVARALLDETDVNMAGPNTALGDAIGLAIRTFETSHLEDRLLILLTDGSDTGSRMTPVNAAEIASQRDVVIHTVGFGDPDSDAEDKVDLSILEQIAGKAGGRFFAAADATRLEQVYTDIDALAPREVHKQSYRPRDSLVHWPAAGAAVLGALGLGLVGLGAAAPKSIPAPGQGSTV